MRHETRVRLVAVGVLGAALVASGWLSVAIAASTGRHQLVYTNRAEDGDPPQVALGIAMGAFRGLFVNFLWLRANALKEAGKYYEAIELSKAITQLQPRFPRVWAFHAWNMSYNISVTTQTPQERWQWVNAGIRLMRDQGLKHNPDDMLMHKELAWIFLHKIGGYTDDANQYYKRELAMEWHEIVGPPPDIRADERERATIVEKYAGRLRAIAAASDTEEQLGADNPAAGELLTAYRQRMGEPSAATFLRRYTFFTELERVAELERTLPDLGPNGQAFHELWTDPAHRGGWDDLVLFMRKRTLVDEYNMEPQRMVRLTETYGPVDWRVPAAHSLYWAVKGTEVGRIEVDEHNSDTLDFVNSYRIVLQSIQSLWRYGDLFFNYLDIAQGKPGFYQSMPNEHFVESYGMQVSQLEREQRERYLLGIFATDRRPYRTYAAGYENFLREAVSFFYRRGDDAKANYWYDVARTWEGQNVHDPDRVDEFSQPLEDFVNRNLYDRFDSPTVAVGQIYASLQGAILEGLYRRDDETFQNMIGFARDVHAYYVARQVRDVVATQGVSRTEYVDRDFRFVAGTMFANIIGALPFDEAQIVYAQAFDSLPELCQYAYDLLAARYKETIDAEAAAGRSPPFDEVFVEPRDMEAFRAFYQRKLAERQQNTIEGLEQQ